MFESQFDDDSDDDGPLMVKVRQQPAPIKSHTAVAMRNSEPPKSTTATNSHPLVARTISTTNPPCWILLTPPSLTSSSHPFQFGKTTDASSVKENSAKHEAQQPGTITFNELLDEVRLIFSNETVNLDDVEHVLQRYKSERADWESFAKSDSQSTHGYTRTLVDRGNNKYNLMLLVWEANESKPPECIGTNCFLKVLDGELRQQLIDTPTNAAIAEPNTLKCNDLHYIHKSMGMHRVENASTTAKAVSLHLYIPPFVEEKPQT